MHPSPFLSSCPSNLPLMPSFALINCQLTLHSSLLPPLHQTVSSGARNSYLQSLKSLPHPQTQTPTAYPCCRPSPPRCHFQSRLELAVKRRRLRTQTLNAYACCLYPPSTTSVPSSVSSQDPTRSHKHQVSMTPSLLPPIFHAPAPSPFCHFQSLLELAVKTSSAATDPMSDNLAFEMDPRSVMELARCGGKYGDTCG